MRIAYYFFFFLGISLFALTGVAQDLQIYQYHKLSYSNTSENPLYFSLCDDENWDWEYQNYKNFQLNGRAFDLTESESKYQMDRIGIEESDTIYIYHLNANKIIKIPVIDVLPLRAELPPYEGSEYYFGIELPKVRFEFESTGFIRNFVFIGNKNPFVENQAKRVLWKQIDHKDFPIVKSNHYQELDSLSKGLKGVFSFNADGLNYYLIEYVEDRYLMVLKDNELVFERNYNSSEGVSMVPISVPDSIEGFYKSDDCQWTGPVFKGKPSMITGMEYHSFGCAQIDFFDLSEPMITIRCDNRH